MRIRLDLSFWGCIQSDFRRAYPVGLGAYPVGFEGKISIAALDIFNGGVKKSNGGIEKGQLEALVSGQGQWGY